MTASAKALVADFVRSKLAAVLKRPLIIGVCGAQGSGKSTLCAQVAADLGREGVKVVVLSLDDLYWPQEVRIKLAEEVHPLLRTRGVPGTHDVALGERVLDALVAGQAVQLPRFDKGRDTRDEVAVAVEGPVDLVLFEGWCVGAVPQTLADLEMPRNALERDRDSDGRWRHYVNDALTKDYHRLFKRLDALVLLAAPEFTAVQTWRTQQEHDLHAKLLREERADAHVMSDDQVAEFIQYYERLTQHILRDMPARADLTLWLDRARQVIRHKGTHPIP